MAARYFVGGGTGDWNSTTNWSASDGGASGASFPIAGDDVFLTAASGVNTLTVNTASACTSITCTGFTGTLAGSSNLTVAGNTTLGAGMTNTYTGNLIISATATINTNGIDLYILTTSGNLITYTLASNIKVTNTWNVNSGSATYFSGAFTIEITGTLNANVASGSINSTSNNTIILLSGNSTFTGYSGAINTGLIFLGFTININSVTTSITNNFRLESNVTLKRIAGVVTTTTSNLGLRGSNITLDTNTIQWTSFSTGVSGVTVTLLSDLNVTGSYTNAVLSTFTGAFNINVGGSLTQSGIINGTGVPATTPTIVLNGTGTWSQSTGHLSTNLTINTAGTITITGTVSFLLGTLTYITGTLVTTSSTLSITSSCTLNTVGMSWNNVTFGASSATFTLTTDLNVGGTFTQSSGSNITFNGADVYCNGSVIVFASNASNITGTSDFFFIGTGTWSGAQAFNCNITITGTYTVSGTVGLTGDCVFTCTTGTMITTGSTFSIPISSSATITINTNQALNNLSSGTATFTLSQDLTLTGTLAYLNNATITFNGNTLYIGGSLTLLGSTIAVGTTNFILNGTGTWSLGTVRNNLTINTLGIITISGALTYGTGTLKYISGTVITAGNTLTINTSTTLDTAGIVFDNITIGPAITITNNSLLTVGGTLSLPNGAVTFDGTHPFTTGHLSITGVLSSSRVYTLLATKVYTITTSFVVTGSSNSFRAIFVSSTPGVQAIFTLSPAGSQNVMYTDATDIDSSAGQTIWSFQQVVSNTLNWGNLNVSNIGGGGTFTFAN